MIKKIRQTTYPYENASIKIDGVLFGETHAELIHQQCFTDQPTEELYRVRTGEDFFLIIRDIKQMNYASGVEVSNDLLVLIQVWRAHEWLTQHMGIEQADTIMNDEKLVDSRRPFSIRMSRSLLARLERIAQRHDWSSSKCINKAVIAWVEMMEKPGVLP